MLLFQSFFFILQQTKNHTQIFINIPTQQKVNKEDMESEKKENLEDEEFDDEEELEDDEE